MKIIIVHYRYFVVGGPEKYLFNIMNKLEREGHEVVPFSVRSKKNVKSEYEKYFVDPIGDDESIYYKEYKKTPRVIAQLLKRSFYDIDVKNSLKKLIEKEKPDLIYCMCYINKLSPSVIDAAKECNVKIVVRLSEYGLMCPNYSFLRNGDICEKCATEGLQHCVKNKCVQGSTMASLVRALSMQYHKMIHIYDHVDAFITPSLFLKKKLQEYKVLKSPVFHVPTFTKIEDRLEYNEKRQNYGLYFGRVAKEKGVEYLVEAYEKLGDDYQLMVVGDDQSEEALRLKKYMQEHHVNNVTFAGFKLGKELTDIIADARYVFVPSIWYDNFPNVVLEAYIYSKPVIASDLGSLPEMVKDHETGLLFETKNSDAIAKCVREMDNDAEVERMSKNAFNCIQEEFSEDIHYQKLMKVFQHVLEDKE